MGCSFYSSNNIVYNELSFIPLKYINTNKINTESYVFSVEDSDHFHFINNNIGKIDNLKSVNLSPIMPTQNLESNKQYLKQYLENKLSANIKGFIFRKKYDDYIKTELMDHTNELYFQFIFLIKNFRSSKLLNNHNDPKVKNIINTKWEGFYNKDPNIVFKNKINKIKKYNNGLKFTYKTNNLDSSDIEQCLKNIESCYKGSVELINNKKCGYGELININGTQQIGTFYNDEFCGWNILINSNGIIYVGLFNNDLLNGHGLLYNSENEYKYKGLFKDSQKEGYGEEYFNGNIYKGDFKEDKKNGKGEIIFKNGDIYIGEFKNDIINGYGKYIWKSKKKEYEGHFMKGKINGNGFLKWGENMYYRGLFNNGIKEGMSECGIIDKKQFFFNFKNNLPFGKGYFIDKYNKKCDAFYNQGKIFDIYMNETIFIFE